MNFVVMTSITFEGVTSTYIRSRRQTNTTQRDVNGTVTGAMVLPCIGLTDVTWLTGLVCDRFA